MPNVYEAFSFNDRTVIGKTLADLTIDFCKTVDGNVVSQTGMTLTELGVGKYVLMNPNITDRTIISGYLTSDSTKSFSLNMDPADGNITSYSFSATSSALAICNNAILGLGGNVIASFDDTSTEAVLCKNLWPAALDSLLRLHPWNCAIKRVVLTPDVTVPVYEWANAFTLPSDLLRLLDIDEVTQYKVEQGKILCNESGLSIRYVFRNEAIDTWDKLLVEAMTSYMSFKMSYPLTKSNTTRDEQWKLFTELLRTSKAIDAQEEPQDTIGDFPFLNVRR
jgi:hypothetical protein